MTYNAIQRGPGRRLRCWVKLVRMTTEVWRKHHGVLKRPPRIHAHMLDKTMRAILGLER